MGNLGDDAEEYAKEHTQRVAAREILTKIAGWRGDKRPTARRRWAFELLQNAIDTAKKRGKHLIIEIDLLEKEKSKIVIFRHNGGVFSHEELCAIIFGGSTKPFAPESEYVGRFGRGFLVTHILAKKVTVNGVAEDKERVTHSFEIVVDRSSEEEKGIVDGIDKCFNQLRTAPATDRIENAFHAEYRYELEGDAAEQAAREGIETLERYLPWVLSFNEEISALRLNGRIYTRKLAKLDSITSKVSIESDMGVFFSDVLLCTIDGDLRVGVMVRENEIQGLGDTPRIFVSMPLIGTETTPIPFVINSRSLELPEERDSLLLAGAENAVDQNKKLLETAFSCFYKIVDFCVQRQYGQIHNLCSFSGMPKEIPSDRGDYWKFFEAKVKAAVRRLRELEIVKTVDRYRKPLDVTFLMPRINAKTVIDDLTEKQFSSFYDIACRMKAGLPVKKEALGWQRTATIWKESYGDNDLRFYSLENLRDEIKNISLKDNRFQPVSQVASAFGLQEKEFQQRIKDLYSLLDGIYSESKIKPDFIDGILINQNGLVMKRIFRLGGPGDAIRDTVCKIEGEDIPGELKDICEGLGYQIRVILIDRDVSQFKITKDFLPDKITVDGVIDEAIQYGNAPKEKVNLEDKRHMAWARLFMWCILNDKRVEGLPVFTKENSVRSIDKESAEPILLVPFEHMGVDKKFEELIPESRILSPKYFDLLADSDKRAFTKKIVEKKICRDSVILKVKRVKMRKEKLRTVLIDTEVELRGKEHEVSVDSEAISTLLFCNELIGRINQVIDRAKLFVDFLLEVVCEKDECWRTQTLASCSCGQKHRIIPSEWLTIIKSECWVPIPKNDEEDQFQPSYASKDSIEKLVGKKRIEEIVKTDIGVELLSHLGFDKLDLTIRRRSIDEERPEKEIRDELAAVFPSVINLIAKSELTEEEIGRALSRAKNDRELERKTDENKRTGTTVEKIITEILREEGITNIVPVHVGADIEIWPEEEGWDGGRLDIDPYRIEVKFTTGNRVRLSKKQAAAAKQTREKYLVLTVTGDVCLKRNQLLIYDQLDSQERQQIRNMIERSSYVVEHISGKLIEAPDPEEVEPDINGYWIKKMLWSQAEGLSKWISNHISALVSP